MSRPKVYQNVPKVNCYQPNLEEFYRFMYERHMIWHRRFVQKLPPPWTDNPILRDYKFTNVYRELDRGTIWYREHVVPRAKTLKELLWLTVMYRLLNKVETFEHCGIVDANCWSASRRNWKESLKRLHKKTSVFTNAHLTLPVRILGQSKVDKYISVLDGFHTDLGKITSEVVKAKNLEEVFNVLRQIDCVGPFISYEVCCDLMLVKWIGNQKTGTMFTENDWVNPGPGCKVGIKLIYPLTRTTEQFQEKIKWLYMDQFERFRVLRLEFPFLYQYKDVGGYLHNTPLTLRSIEHSLCEFCKYMKMKTGIGKQRMYFKPVTGIDNGQIPMRFPREESQ